MKLKNYRLDFDHKYLLTGDNLLEVEGLSYSSASFETSLDATGEGSVVIGSTLNNREISILSKVKLELADYSIRFFAPKKEMILYVGERTIKCIVNDSSIIYNTTRRADPNIRINLMCPDPYFYDINDFGENIAGVMPMFGFPWTATIARGITFGYRIYSDTTIFKNKGDKPVGFKIVFVSARGESSGIKFENLLTGEYIKVNIELNQGDKLEISTMYKNIYIRKNGENMLSKVDRISEPFRLDVGDNLLKYSADAGQTNLDAYLYYTPAYSNGEVIER